MVIKLFDQLRRFFYFLYGRIYLFFLERPFFKVGIQISFFYFFLLRFFLFLALGGVFNFYSLSFEFRFGLYVLIFLLAVLFVVCCFNISLRICYRLVISFYLALTPSALFIVTRFALLSNWLLRIHFLLPSILFALIFYLNSEFLLGLLLSLFFLRTINHLAQRPFVPNDVTYLINFRLYFSFLPYYFTDQRTRTGVYFNTVAPSPHSFNSVSQLLQPWPVYVSHLFRYFLFNPIFIVLNCFVKNFPIFRDFHQYDLIPLYRSEPFLNWDLSPEFVFHYLSAGRLYLTSHFSFNAVVDLVCFFYFFVLCYFPFALVTLFLLFNLF